MTLDNIASAIQNNVGGGLKEVTNFTYSLDQIKHEVSNLRSLIIMQDADKGILNRSYFAQKRENIKLSAGIFPEEGIIENNNPVLTAKIPKLAMTRDNSSVLYLGPTDMSLNIKTYFSLTDLKAHKYTRTIKNRPFAYLDLAHDKDGNITVYIANVGPAPFKYITTRAIFDDPVKILQEYGYLSDDEFPAPLAVQDLIINQLSTKYLNYYKKFSAPNEQNDQTDKS